MPAASSSSCPLDRQSVLICETLWRKYFPCPRDTFQTTDRRLAAVDLFMAFFGVGGDGHALVKDVDPAREPSVFFDVAAMTQLLPFPDFVPTLRRQPNEVIGCMGLAISVLKTKELAGSNLHEPFCVWPRFQNLPGADTEFGELRSGIVGQLVSLSGYVVKVSACRPLIEGGSFHCAKCDHRTWATFEDGVFTPPESCQGPGCGAKYGLDFVRSSVVASDFQRVKLQELDRDARARGRGSSGGGDGGDGGDKGGGGAAASDGVAATGEGAREADYAARVPRTFEVEVRAHPSSPIPSPIPPHPIPCPFDRLTSRGLWAGAR